MRARFFKTILFSGLSAVAAFAAITYSSCNPDKCKSIACAYNGVCNDGACICPTGYEGARCETISRDKFLGVWNVIEQGTTSDISQYAVSVKPDSGSSDPSAILIYNFYNAFTVPVKAKVTHDTMYIANNQTDATIKYTVVVGTGYIQGATDESHPQMAVYYTMKNTATGKTNDFGVAAGAASVWSK